MYGGGSLPATGFDCSGLIQWGYFQSMNISSFRMGNEIVNEVNVSSLFNYNVLELDDKNLLKRGDLIFIDEDGFGRFNHVAVYDGDSNISGMVWVIDASDRTGIVSRRELMLDVYPNIKYGRKLKTVRIIE
ncbi:MAG: NlpC/P60 family protein [Oceanicaulis sp.]|nr:NlpC/P60 family protein [Oceanicaulis sp.]